MGNLQNNQDGFNAVEVILVIIIVALIGVVGWLVYKSHHKNTTKSSTTVSSTKPATTTKLPTQTPNPYDGWTKGTISSEKLTFYYPSGWNLQMVKDADYIQLLQLINSSGFTVTIDALKPGSSAAQYGGSGGQTPYNTTVGQSNLDGQTVYYLDTIDPSNGQYSGTELSSCNGAKKCLYQSPVTGDDIEASVAFHLQNDQAPGEFSPTSPAYLQALNILKSLSIE